MTQRVLLGQRGASTGLWCSKPGYDVTTTSSANMSLDISTRGEQFLQFGFVNPGSVVGLGYAAPPLVIINDVATIGGGTALPRPFPFVDYANIWSRVVVNADYFYTQDGFSGPFSIRLGFIYFVYRRRL